MRLRAFFFGAVLAGIVGCSALIDTDHIFDPLPDASSIQDAIAEGGDSGSSPASARLRCPTVADGCALAKEACCGTNVGQSGIYRLSYACLPANASQTDCTSTTGEPLLLLRCATALDCRAMGYGPSAVCCATHTSPGGAVYETACVGQQAHCAETSKSIACDPASALSCPTGTQCKAGPFNFLDYFDCQ